MTLRDLSKLDEIMRKKINLGLDVGNLSTLSEFNDDIKSNNFIFSLGTEILKKVFSSNNEILKNLRNFCLIKLKHNKSAKLFFYKIANKGFNF